MELSCSHSSLCANSGMADFGKEEEGDSRRSKGAMAQVDGKRRPLEADPPQELPGCNARVRRAGWRFCSSFPYCVPAPGNCSFTVDKRNLVHLMDVFQLQMWFLLRLRGEQVAAHREEDCSCSGRGCGPPGGTPVLVVKRGVFLLQPRCPSERPLTSN